MMDSEIMDNRQYYADLWWRALNGDQEAREEVRADDLDSMPPPTESYVGSPAFYRDAMQLSDGARRSYIGATERAQEKGSLLSDPPFFGPPTTRAGVRALWRWHKENGMPPASGGLEERAAVARYRAELSAIDALIRESGGRPPA